jgi:predicted metal-dependent hydrolase
MPKTEIRDSPTRTDANTLSVGDLHFTIKRSARRRTMQITVERDGRLVLSVPPEVKKSALRQFVLEKRFWIYTKLAEKDCLLRGSPAKEYVDGEGFLYLGRSYRLRLIAKQDVALKLVAGRFLLRRDAVTKAEAIFTAWYGDRARPWLSSRIATYRARMDVTPAGVKVQDLGYRWGSCGKGDWLYFHWKTVLLPPRIAEYVVVHEMAHLHEPHHTKAFWQHVERAMPDYAKCKAWLAEHGSEVDAV